MKPSKCRLVIRGSPDWGRIGRRSVRIPTIILIGLNRPLTLRPRSWLLSYCRISRATSVPFTVAVGCSWLGHPRDPGIAPCSCGAHWLCMTRRCKSRGMLMVAVSDVGKWAESEAVTVTLYPHAVNRFIADITLPTALHRHSACRSCSRMYCNPQSLRKTPLLYSPCACCHSPVCSAHRRCFCPLDMLILPVPWRTATSTRNGTVAEIGSA